MKKIVVIFLIFCAVCPCLSSCSKPKEEDIYDRVVYLVEGAKELNTVFYGAGLPVYAADSDYAEFTHMYFNFPYAGSYESVMENTKFLSVDAIKQRAALIYSRAYCEEVLYPMAFDGHAISDSMGGMALSHAKFYEDESWIYRTVLEDTNYLEGMRVFDYSTMKVVRPSNKKACIVEIRTWLEDTPNVVRTIQLRLVKQNGEWYLDSLAG